MKKYLFWVTWTLLICNASVVAGAGNFYLGALGGGVFLNDADYISNTAGTTGKLGFDTGYGAGAFAGYNLGKIPIRFEAEVMYRKNDIDEFRIASNTYPNAGGDISALSAMINWYWDFLGEMLVDSPVNAFILAGVGAAKIEIDGLSVNGVPAIDGSDDTAFAAQIGGGIGYAITEWLTIDLSYRFFFVDDFDIEDTNGGQIELQYSSNNALLGFRFSFK